MDSYRPLATQEAGTVHAYRTFFAWVGVEVLGYALAVVLASDEPNSGCTGLCFSDQGLLVLFAMMFGVFVLGGQVIVGLLLTKWFDRGRRSPYATGSAAFFITFLLAALVLTLLAVAQ